MSRCPSCGELDAICECSQWCEECGGMTNHTTALHRAMARETDDIETDRAVDLAIERERERGDRHE